MKKLIYKVEGYIEEENPETNEVEKRLSLATVTVENPTAEDIENAAKNAYNGEYTIDDDGRPEPVVPDTGETSFWEEMDAAYQRGVDSV